MEVKLVFPITVIGAMDCVDPAIVPLVDEHVKSEDGVSVVAPLQSSFPIVTVIAIVRGVPVHPPKEGVTLSVPEVALPEKSTVTEYPVPVIVAPVPEYDQV